MERVTYKQDGTKKLDYCNLHIFAGEIFGLLPVNSDGLSSFLDVLKTNLPLYDGYIYYNEMVINSWKEGNRQANRITIIGDKSSLVEDLTVTDNIFVLRPNFRNHLISIRFLERQLQPFLTEIGISIHAKTYVDRLTVFQRIVVEILKGVVAGHKLIVLTEIQNLVTPGELGKIQDIMQFYKKKGISFLYVSVHFEDILYICDRAAFFQNGRITRFLQEKEMTPSHLGVNIGEYQNIVKHYVQTKEAVQKIAQCNILYHFAEEKNTLHLQVAPSECVVIQCLNNEMHQELLQMLISQKVPRGSCLLLGGKRPRPHSRDFAIIGQQPAKTMVFPELSYLDNLCFNLDSRVKGVWVRGNIRSSVRQEYGAYLGDVFDTPVDQLTETQKYTLLYTRIALQKPKVVFCVQPFKGADLPLRMHIFTLLEKLLKQGISLIILSFNLADTLSIADRLVVLEEGKPQREYTREQFKTLKTDVPWKTI